MHRTSLVTTMVLCSLSFACGAGDNYVGSESADGGSPQTGTGGSPQTGTGGSPQTASDARDACGSCGDGTAKLALSSSDVCLSAQVGMHSATKTFAVVNSGTATSGPLTAILSGPAAQSFTITNNTCTGSGLAPGANCSVAVVYAPAFAHAAAENATLVVADAETSASAPLVGNDAGNATATPAVLDFGEVLPGSTSQEMLVRVATTAGCELRWTASIDNPDFVISSKTCTGLVRPGDVCQVGVRFSPSANAAPSSVAGQLTLAGSDSRMATVALHGVVMKSTPPERVPLSASLAAIDFGEVTVGKPSVPANVTVISSGAALTVSLGAVSSPAFAVTLDTCTGSIAPGATCTIQVQFAPTVAGANVGTLTVSDGQTSATVSLVGIGIAAQATVPFTVSPMALDFGEVPVGKSSVSLTVTVTVTTPSTKPFTLMLSGAAAQDFTIDSNSCAAEVPAGGTCTLSLKFAPTQASTRDAALHVTDGTYDVAATLTGKGVIL